LKIFLQYNREKSKKTLQTKRQKKNETNFLSLFFALFMGKITEALWNPNWIIRYYF